jgi:hypothetical protein
LSEIGPYCDSANDPVTTDFAFEFMHLCRAPLAAARSRRNHVDCGMVLKRESLFPEKIMPWMTGGVAWI